MLSKYLKEGGTIVIKEGVKVTYDSRHHGAIAAKGDTVESALDNLRRKLSSNYPYLREEAEAKGIEVTTSKGVLFVLNGEDIIFSASENSKELEDRAIQALRHYLGSQDHDV